MNFLRKFRRQFYVIENKVASNQLKLDKKMPLFNTELSAFVEEQNSFDQVRQMSLQNQQDFIVDNYELMEHYKQIGPYQVYASLSQMQNCFVLKAEYIQENKMIQMEVMDVDGFYTKYVSIEDLIPQTYSDYLSKYKVEIPYMDFVDKDRILKQNGTNCFFLFLEEGEWNSETANLKDFDFRNLYSEDRWLFDQVEW